MFSSIAPCSSKLANNVSKLANTGSDASSKKPVPTIPLEPIAARRPSDPPGALVTEENTLPPAFFSASTIDISK